MKTNNNVILINGGSAGIGLAMAKLFSPKNKVIITGRNRERLDAAVAQLQNATGILCDVISEKDVQDLLAKIKQSFPGLNVVINNAGKGNIYDISEENAGSFSKALEEMQTNYLSVIRLCEMFLPTLKKQEESAIVNVSSIAVYGPRVPLATYGASKAALHAYTLALRYLLKSTGVKVFELMPPLVNTEFTKDFGGSEGIAPQEVAASLMSGFINDVFEIHVGQTAQIHDRYFADAYKGFEVLNNRN